MSLSFAHKLLLLGGGAPTLAQFYARHARLFAYDMTETDERQILYDRANGLSAGPNLLPNGNFDGGLTTGWNVVGGAAIEVASHDGSNMLHVTSTAAQANNDGTNTDAVDTGSGNIYRGTGYLDVELGSYNLAIVGVSPALSRTVVNGTARYFSFEGVDVGSVRWQFLSNGGGVDHEAFGDNFSIVDSTNLRDAVIYGAVSQSQLGPDGNVGAVLVAATGFAKFQNRAIVQGLTEFTHHQQAFFSNAGESNAGVILFKNGEYSLSFNAATGELTATVNRAVNATCVTTTQIPFDAWVSVHMRYNDIDGIALLLEGDEMNYASNVVGSGARVSNTNNIRLWNNETPNAALQGLVSRVNMFEDALSADQIAQHTVLVSA